MLRKLLLFSLASIILFQSARGTFVYLSLKLNQEQIAAEYCIAEDITMCYGSCYIEKEVKKAEQDTQKSTSKISIEKSTFWFNDHFEKIEVPVTNTLVFNSKPNIPPYVLKSTKNVFLKLLQPPQNITV